MRRSQQAGFSLIELLIAVILIGVLMAIAIPNYTSYLERTRRSDARVALLEVAAAQERWYFENNQYTGTIANVWSNQVGGASVSADEYYTLSVALNGNNRFTATATAAGKQTGDVDCATLTIDETGNRGATAGTGGDATVCW